MPLEAGDVIARLGFAFDPSGKKAWDREREAAERATHDPIKQELGFDVDDAALKAYRAELEAIKAQTRRRDAFKAHLGADFDEDAFKRAEAAMARHARLTRDTDHHTRALTSSFGRAGAGSDGLSLRLAGVGGRMDHILRILTLLSPAVYAAGGSLVALTGSATAAAGGLGALGVAAGGALTPIVALGGAVIQRAGLMAEAYKAVTQQGEQQATDAVEQADRQETAVKAVQAAEEAHRDAMREVQRAQEDLTDARARARREVQDLRDAVGDAALAERGAAIDLERSLERLAEVRADPDASGLDLREAELAVDQAREGVRDAREEAKRAREDARKGTDTLRDARERLARANEQAAKAQEQITEATEASTEAARQESTAAENADAALAKLSRTERQLVAQVRLTAATIRAVFRPATDAIFGATDRALERLDPRLRSFRNEFTDLGDVIAGAIGGGSTALAGSQGEQLERIFARADVAAEDLADSLGSVARILINIAEAAMPELERTTGKTADALDRIADATDDSERLERRIRELVRASRLWWDLLKDVGDLLGTILGGGERQGNQLVRQLDRIVERWDKFLESREGQRAMRNFFKDARDLLADIVEFLKGMVLGFKDLAEFLAPVVHFFARLAADLTGIDRGADGIEKIGRVFGALALLKLTGVTRLVGMLLRLGGAGAGISAIFRSLRSGEGILGGLGDVFTGRGSSPARPLFVFDVSGGGGVGVPGGGRGGRPGGGGGPGLLGRFGRVGGGVGLAAGLGGLGVLIELTSKDWDDLTRRLDNLIEGPRDSPRAKHMRDIARALQQAKEAGDHKRLRELAGDIDAVAEGASDKNIGQGLRELARDVRGVADSAAWPELKDVLRTTQERFRLLAKDSKADLDDIRLAVRYNMGRVRERLGEDSAAGRAAVSDNFDRAIDAVERQMRRGVVTTREGMKAIRGFVAEELEVYGLSIRQARNIAKGTPQGGRYGDPDNVQGREGGAFRARGGWIGAPGMAGQDTVQVAPNVWAAHGEWHGVGQGGRGLVLNRHQAPVGELALAITHAMGGKYGSLAQLGNAPVDQPAYLDSAMRSLGMSVDGLLAAIDRPHYLAGGGRIVPVPGFPGERAAQSILDEIAWVTRRFGLVLTDAFGPGHKSPGHTRFGTAADFAGGDAAMGAAVKALVRMGYLVGYDGSYGSEDWSGHGPASGQGGDNAHLHVEFGRKGGRLLDMVARVPRQAIRGGGAVGRAAQRGLNLARSGAQQFLDQASIGLTGLPVAGGGSRNSAQIRGWLAAGLRLAGLPATGANINTLYGRVIQESGGNPRAINLWDSNAARGTPSKGLLQTIDSTFDAYKVRGYGNIWNPVHNVAAAVRYMLARYGHLVGRSPTGAGYAVGGRYADGAIFAQQGVRYGSNTASGSGNANEKFPRIKALRRKITDRIHGYDRLVALVEEDRDDYSRIDRRYGLSEEVMIDEETGAVDIGQTQARLGELDELKRIRERIAGRLRDMRALVQRIINTYKTLIRQLTKSLEKARGKKNAGRRKGIEAQIAAYQKKLREWEGVLGDVDDDVFDADTDVLEIGGEWSEVAAILSAGQAGRLAPGFTPRQTATDQAIAEQAIAKAAGLSEELKSANAQIAALSSPGGDFGTGEFATVGGALFGGPRGTVAPTHPAATIPGIGAVPAGTPITVINQTINTLHPGDPEVHRALASSVVQGFSQQPYRPSTGENFDV